MWALKIVVKIILSKIPLKYSYWRKLGIFKNGRMNEIEYSKKIFFGHLEDLRKIKKIKNPRILEIGPGDGISSAIFARIYESQKVYLVDIGDFADRDIKKYKKMISLFKDHYSFKNLPLSKFKKVEDILYNFNASYLKRGLESMKNLKDKSVDYIFSHSVMEHIRKSDIDEMINEMFRILSDDGLISHNINYKDHLGESLHNLRFSEKIWESEIFANSGFYTNRIPAIEMHKKFSRNGFKIIWENFGSWSRMPLKRKYIHNDFNSYSDRDLMKCTSAFIAKK